MRVHVAHERDDARLVPAGFPVEDVLGLEVGQPLGRLDDRACVSPAGHFARRVVADDRALAEPPLALLEAAHAVGQDFGQHGDDFLGEVRAGASAAGLLVQRSAFAHEMRHVGDMHAQRPGAVAVGFQADGVVVVARVGRIDGDDGQGREVLPAVDCL